MTKKFLFIYVLLITTIIIPCITTAQVFYDTFTTMRPWSPASGSWVIRGGRLTQQDSSEKLARIDRAVPQQEIYEIEFSIQYRGGGYKSMQDLRRGIFHAGFGIHIGADNPLEEASWGNEDSYLLWLNVDTRPEIRQTAPEHYGFRAQVYRSNTHTSMFLANAPAATPLSRFFSSKQLFSLDIIEATQAAGIYYTMQDAQRILSRPVVINIRVNTTSGEVSVRDPFMPVRYAFSVDPTVLRGRYVSLRTNSLAVSFDYFTLR
jgi:hypothetical protein